MKKKTEWTGERIRNLRKSRGQTQSEFGLDIFKTEPAPAQRRVSALEREVKAPPSIAVIRTLERMKEGEI